MRLHSITIFTVAALALAAEVQAQNGNSSWLEVKRGTVSFQAVTNVSAINIHGQSNAERRRLVESSLGSRPVICRLSGM